MVFERTRRLTLIRIEAHRRAHDWDDTDEAAMLRDHGLTADRIKAANGRAGTRLPIDMLKTLASGGKR